MKRLTFLIALILTALISTPGFAHQGHTSEDLPVSHYLLTPVHIIPIALVIGTALYMIAKIITFKKS